MNNKIELSRSKSSQTYQPKPLYEKMIQQRDVMIPMRDGVHLCVDIYCPEASGRFPALLSFAFHNKDLLSPEVAESLPPQPAWSTLWMGNIESEDTEYLVSRGYVHVTSNPRGVGKSEDGGSPDWDSYALIEWLAHQPWCDGNIGMIGLSAFGAAQLEAAMHQPPHLKAIFACDPGGKNSSLYRHWLVCLHI